MGESAAAGVVVGALLYERDAAGRLVFYLDSRPERPAHLILAPGARLLSPLGGKQEGEDTSDAQTIARELVEETALTELAADEKKRRIAALLQLPYFQRGPVYRTQAAVPAELASPQKPRSFYLSIFAIDISVLRAAGQAGILQAIDPGPQAAGVERKIITRHSFAETAQLALRDFFGLAGDGDRLLRGNGLGIIHAMAAALTDDPRQPYAIGHIPDRATQVAEILIGAHLLLPQLLAAAPVSQMQLAQLQDRLEALSDTELAAVWRVTNHAVDEFMSRPQQAHPMAMLPAASYG